MNSNHRGRLVAALALIAASVAGICAAGESASSLRAEATITETDAAKTALARVPGGTIKSTELEREHGKLVWSFDIAKPKSANIEEVQIDARNGTVAAIETETPDDQAAEAAEEDEAADAAEDNEEDDDQHQ